MCCFFFLFVALGPRFAIICDVAVREPGRLGVRLVGVAVPGVLVAPWTTLMYLLAWSPVGGVSGWEWILVGLGVAGDIAMAAKPAQSRFATS